MNIQYKVSSETSKFLEPVGNSSINVVKDMAWTLTPSSARTEVPKAYLEEYQQTQGQLVASILFWGRIIGGAINGTDLADKDLYKFKYIGKPTGWSYIFPSFNPKKLSRSNQFSYTDGASPFSPLIKLAGAAAAFGRSRGALTDFVGRTGAWAGAIAGVASTAIPGNFDLEHPQSWTQTQNDTHDITFDLFNTGTMNDIENNRNLCHLLTYQNSPSRRVSSFAIVDPPCIYALYVPDVVSMPACYMSALNITNLGNTRQLMTQDGVRRIIPEAYRIHMSFTSLLMPTRNILKGLDTGELLTAISNVTDEQLKTMLSSAVKSLDTTASNTNKIVTPTP